MTRPSQPSDPADMLPRDFREFRDAYREAIVFTDCQYEEDEGYGAAFSADMEERIEADCRAFCNAHHLLFKPCGARKAGHDFWLTRNGHGAGFWDGGWPEPQSSVLDDASESFGVVVVEKGDDGLLHMY